MASVGLSQMPDDLVAAIVLRAFHSDGATLRARLNMGLVCRAWRAALAGCTVNVAFHGAVTAAQEQWLAVTAFHVASLSFAPVGSDGKGADPASTHLLLGSAEPLAASEGSLAAMRNLVVPLTVGGAAALRCLGDRFPALRSLGIILCSRSPTGTVLDARLAEVLKAVPAAVEDLEVTFLVDLFVAFEGMCLSHVRSLRRLTLHGPCLEAMFCGMKGLAEGLEEATISAPCGEVAVILDDGANRLVHPLKVFRAPGCTESKGRSTSMIGLGMGCGGWRSVQLTIVDATHCGGTSADVASNETNLLAQDDVRRQGCEQNSPTGSGAVVQETGDDMVDI